MKHVHENLRHGLRRVRCRLVLCSVSSTGVFFQNVPSTIPMCIYGTCAVPCIQHRRVSTAQIDQYYTGLAGTRCLEYYRGTQYSEHLFEHFFSNRCHVPYNAQCLTIAVPRGPSGYLLLIQNTTQSTRPSMSGSRCSGYSEVPTPEYSVPRSVAPYSTLSWNYCTFVHTILQRGMRDNCLVFSSSRVVSRPRHATPSVHPGPRTPPLLRPCGCTTHLVKMDVVSAALDSRLEQLSSALELAKVHFHHRVRLQITGEKNKKKGKE